MLKALTGGLAAVAAFGGLALSTTGAGAVPMFDTAPAVASAAAAAGSVEEARLVCGPFRCFHRPNYGYPVYGYGYRRWHHPYYGWHRPYYGGWHRGYGYHHWHRW